MPSRAERSYRNYGFLLQECLTDDSSCALSKLAPARMRFSVYCFQTNTAALGMGCCGLAAGSLPLSCFMLPH